MPRKLGSWREVRPNVWQVRVSNGYKSDGSRRVVTRTVHGAEDDARREAERIADELGRSPSMLRGVTFGNVWARYLERRAPKLAKKTVSSYAWVIKKDWMPRFEQTDVSAISHADIQAALLSMTHDRAIRAKRVISAVLSWAVSVGMVDENAAQGAYELPRSDETTKDAQLFDSDPFAAIEGSRGVWDARTVMAAFPLMRGLPLEPCWLACVGAGLRVEEALALRRLDVRRIAIAGRMVTQLAVHHARPDTEEYKATKTSQSVRIVAVAEPFGARLWEVAETITDGHALLCPLSAANQNRAWRLYFQAPPETWHKRMGESRKCQGRLHGLPYQPMSRMRATHATLMQEAGVLDSVNAAVHGHSEQVAYANYKRPDLTDAAAQVGSYLSLVS